jgi:hypothetical protein
MIAHYKGSRRLQGIRFSRQCYSLLNRARIAPHNLHHFYRTYRLPCDPFFPLFFSIKRDYLAERERLREARRQYILAAMRALPADVLTQIKYLGNLERHYNPIGNSPLWQRHLFPGSKKRADEYARFAAPEWHALYREHLARLVERYPSLTTETAKRVLACFLFGIIPDRIPPARPARSEVTRRYRQLSLLHHPDRGGDPKLFVSIKHARDALVGSE